MTAIHQASIDWKEVHDTLCALSKRHAELDFEIGVWLLVARDIALHRYLGFGSFGEYASRLFDGRTRPVRDRLRVAEALRDLPELSEALRDGSLCWSAVRELTRVATANTETEWLLAARGRTVHEVERLVSGRRPGDRPSDPSRPEYRRHVLRFEVSAETFATYREAVKLVQQQTHGAVDDDTVLLVMAQSVLGSGAAGPGEAAGAAGESHDDANTPDPGRAPHQISFSLCPSCHRGRQEGGGELVDVPAEVVEMAQCDAVLLGSVDGAEPSRATQTVPPARRRQVMRRHHGQCAVTGCRNAAFLSIHHLRLRSEGGDHDPLQMIPLCGAHHRATHVGQLVITGTVDAGLEFSHADGTPYGEPPSPQAVEAFALAFEALKTFGFREGETRRALDQLRRSGQLGAEPTPGVITKAALRVLRPIESLPVKVSSAAAPARAASPSAREPRAPYALTASSPEPPGVHGTSAA